MAHDLALSQLKSLMDPADVPELGPGPRQGAAALADLRRRMDAILSASSIPFERQDLIRSLLLLWHDHLDASHRISQGIDSTDGSYVHGLMHRREPDYGNAKYWFRRVGNHECFPSLMEHARHLASPQDARNPAGRLLRGAVWDAFAFVDFCEEVAGRPRQDPRVRWLEEMQKAEFTILLNHFCG